MDTYHVDKGITIERVIVGALANNVWLIRQANGPTILIDCADEPGVILDAIGEDDVAIILTTHSHHDHIGALHAIASQLNADNLAGTPDCDAIETQTGLRPDGVWTGDSVGVGDVVLDVIGLVGHTPGSIALVYEPAHGPTYIFTGDSLFPGGVGKTAGIDDFTMLLTGVQEQILEVFEPDTVILPGHGEATTVGAELAQVDAWWERGW